MARSILVIDDEKNILKTIEGILTDEGFEVHCETSAVSALKKIDEMMPDLVILDIWMPDMNGIDALVKFKQEYPYIQVIMISGHADIETAVKATKLGAYDFIQKPLTIEELLLAINNALNFYQLEEEISILRERDKSRYHITGKSASIKRLKESIEKAAPTNATILIMGENGTGKELVAHNIHRLSTRSHKPMIEVNCAAIPEELIESELFGHEKGAFTGAGSKKKGKFDIAHEGTLFLDEIGDMSLKAQSKTLRILQEQKFERVGGSRTIHVNVRIISATNKNLTQEIEKGNFREDLFYRLNVVPILVPPLRERVEDIPDLISTLMNQTYLINYGQKKKQFSEEAIELLKQYSWPGNVRELKNLVENLIIMSSEDVIKIDDIPAPYNQSTSKRDEYVSFLDVENYKDARIIFEKIFITAKLKKYKGNISQTAEAIGVERSNLHKKIKAYGLEDFRTVRDEV
ncbi:MAG: sigma-54-dependent Fis family transcriptional regulator [Deltaproteobacteria bacterium]|nr:sigma-54-dependent Fis family transcriptional regulator [Deltaproteobacteria bacterium]